MLDGMEKYQVNSPLVETTIATEKDRADAENDEKQDNLASPLQNNCRFADHESIYMYMCVRVGDNEASWYHM